MTSPDHKVSATPLSSEDSSDAVKSAQTQLDKFRLRLEDDLKIAECVLRSMIPASGRRGRLEIVTDFRPTFRVGGDYASVHSQSDQCLVVGICDVAGHGIAAALLASRVNSFVLSRAPSIAHPCQLVESLNDFVYRTFRETGLYLTFFSISINLQKQTLAGAGCGHPPMLLYSKQDGALRRWMSENTPIGLFEDLGQTDLMSEMPFRPGDRLLLYTDGVTEATARDGRELGVNGLEDYFRELAHLPLQTCVETIIRRVHDFRDGAPANDDQLLLAISHLEPGATVTS